MQFVATLKNSFRSLKRILQFKTHDQSTSLGVSDERYRRILFAGASTLMVKIVSVSISLITVPLTIHYLGAERYGLWMSISSIMSLMNFADLGLGNGLLNSIAKAHGKNDIELAKKAVSSTFFILTCISLFLLLVFVGIYPFVHWQRIFNVHDPLAVKEAGPTMAVLVFTFLVNIPLDVIQRLREGYQEGFKFQLWLLVGSMISFLLLLICLHYKGGLPYLVGCYSIGPLMALLTNGFFLFRKKPDLFPRFKSFDLQTGRNLIQLGLVFFTLQVFTLLANSSDDIIIAQVIGATHVAIFEVVKKIFLFSMLTQFIIQPLWPAFAEALAKDDIVWVKKTFKKMMLISLPSSGLIALPLVIWGRTIISYWVGAGFIPDWSLLFGFYAFIFVSNYLGVMSTFLNSNDELLKKQTFMIGFAAITSIVLKIILSKYMGVSGAIWATVTGYCVCYVIPSYQLSNNFLKRKSLKLTAG